MTSKHLVDPDLLGALDVMPSFVLTRENLPAVREGLLQMLVAATPAPEDGRVAVTRQVIPNPAGASAIELLIYTPANASAALPVIFHIHPGGHIMGAPEMSDTRNRYLAQAVDAMVVSVKYRLAPEHAFPAALNDVDAGLTWLKVNSAVLGIDASRIAIAGESAGGGLAASLTQLTRDRGDLSIVYQLLSYPMLDNRTGTSVEPGRYTGEFLWTSDNNTFAWKALLGEGQANDETRPYAAPGRCDDLAGLPPAYIAVGALDLFVDEDISYAQRLIRAGVPTELHVYPGAYHGFDIVPTAWAARDLLASQTAALRRALYPAPAAD